MNEVSLTNYSPHNIMKSIIKNSILAGLVMFALYGGYALVSSKAETAQLGGQAQRWSYSTVAASSTVVSATPTLLVGASVSPDILKLGEFINEGSNVVYVCAFAETCTTSNGQPLTQYGYYSIDDANPWQGAVYAVTASGTSTVSIRTTK